MRRRIFAFTSIFLVCLSSALATDWNGFILTSPDAGDISAKVVEDDDGAQQDFKESVNLGQVGTNRVRCQDSYLDAGQQFQEKLCIKFLSYHQKREAQKPSRSTNIQLGVLII